jgi:hypothetical protein
MPQPVGSIRPRAALAAIAASTALPPGRRMSSGGWLVDLGGQRVAGGRHAVRQRHRQIAVHRHRQPGAAIRRDLQAQLDHRQAGRPLHRRAAVGMGEPQGVDPAAAGREQRHEQQGEAWAQNGIRSSWIGNTTRTLSCSRLRFIS